MIRLVLILSLASSLMAQDFSIQQRRPPATASVQPASFAYVAGSVTACWLDSGGATQCPAVALKSNPVAGQLMVVDAWWHDTGTVTASFSCVNNTTWTTIGSKRTGAGALAAFSGQLFYTVLNVSGGDNCTLTFSGSVTQGGWEGIQFTYTGTISATDGTPVYSNTAAVASVATISGLTTTSSTGVLIPACMAVASACSVGAGFTSQNDTAACHSINGTSCAGGTVNYLTQTGSLIEYKFNAAAGAQSATFGTGGATDAVILGMVAF